MTRALFVLTMLLGALLCPRYGLAQGEQRIESRMFSGDVVYVHLATISQKQAEVLRDRLEQTANFKTLAVNRDRMILEKRRELAWEAVWPAVLKLIDDVCKAEPAEEQKTGNVAKFTRQISGLDFKFRT